MAELFEILSANLTGEIPDDGAITQNDIAAFSKRLHRVIPRELAELLVVTNGLKFDPAASFRGCEVLGFLSLWGIERTLQTQGEFIPPFVLPFAHSMSSLYCLASSGIVYTLTGIGDQMPRIVVEPTYLSVRMFCEELKSTA